MDRSEKRTITAGDPARRRNDAGPRPAATPTSRGTSSLRRDLGGQRPDHLHHRRAGGAAPRPRPHPGGAGAEGGLPRLTSHGLRHTAATHMVRSARDVGELRAVADVLGHSPTCSRRSTPTPCPRAPRPSRIESMLTRRDCSRQATRMSRDFPERHPDTSGTPSTRRSSCSPCSRTSVTTSSTRPAGPRRGHQGRDPRPQP